MDAKQHSDQYPGGVIIPTTKDLDTENFFSD